MNPQTVTEWEEYIEKLAGPALWSKAIAAKSQKFVDALLSEGMGMESIHLIMIYFVRQCARTGMKVPGGGAFDLVAMAEVDPVAREGRRVDPFTVKQMANQVPEEDFLEETWFSL